MNSAAGGVSSAERYGLVGVADYDKPLSAGYGDSLVGCHTFARVEVNNLIVPQTHEICLKVLRCSVVELNCFEAGHCPPGFDVLNVCAAEVNHAPVGVDREQLLIEWRDEVSVETRRQQLSCTTAQLPVAWGLSSVPGNHRL